MKLVFPVFIAWFIYILHVFRTPVNGQYFEDATRHFKKFEFEKSYRGSFNISYCLRSLINCMEVVRPDLLCSRGVYHMTVCGSLKEVCHDAHGDLDNYRHRFEIEQRDCHSTDFAELS